MEDGRPQTPCSTRFTPSLPSMRLGHLIRALHTLDLHVDDVSSDVYGDAVGMDVAVGWQEVGHRFRWHCR